MTKNIKRLLVLVLVLSMTGSTMIIAWANDDPPHGTGEAEIEFVGAWSDEIVPQDPDEPGPVEPGEPPPIDPHDPDDPDEWEDPPDPDEDIDDPPAGIDPPSLIASMGLDFWEHYQPNVLAYLTDNASIDFHSMRIRNGDWDVGIPADTPPLVERNRETVNLSDQSVTGLWVTAAKEGGDWRVTVQVSAFSDGALDGANLSLRRFSPLVVGIDVDSTARPTVEDNVTLSTDNTAEDIMNGTVGFVGGTNFEGRLTAFRDTSFVDATAQMTWTFVRGTPGGGGG